MRAAGIPGRQPPLHGACAGRREGERGAGPAARHVRAAGGGGGSAPGSRQGLVPGLAEPLCCGGRVATPARRAVPRRGGRTCRECGLLGSLAGGGASTAVERGAGWVSRAPHKGREALTAGSRAPLSWAPLSWAGA